jgi:SpoIID/LytB domain protein
LKLVLNTGAEVLMSYRRFSKFVNFPSALFWLTPNGDVGSHLAQMKVRGLGSGHGVGMSQNGGKYLAKNLGWDAKQILNYYYSRINLCTVYGSNPAYNNCMAIN